MKRYKLFFGAAALMVLGFSIHVLVDYIQYNATLNSAPFRIWIYVDAAIYLIPAAICTAIGFVAKKKLTHKEK